MGLSPPERGSSAPEISRSGSPSESDGSNDMCKICHCGASDASLLSPCKCKGSLAYSHADCIMKWLNYSSRRKCELCKTKFNLKKVGYKPCSQWQMVTLTCDEVLHFMLLFCCVAVVLGSVLCWRNIFAGHHGYSLFFRSSSMKMIVYITYGPLNLLCLVLGALEIKLIVIPSIRRWMLLNQEIIVVPYGSKGSAELGARNAAEEEHVPATDQQDNVSIQHGKKTTNCLMIRRSQLPRSYFCHDWNRKCHERSFHKPLITASRSAGSLDGIYNSCSGWLQQTRSTYNAVKANWSENPLPSAYSNPSKTTSLIKGLHCVPEVRCPDQVSVLVDDGPDNKATAMVCLNGGTAQVTRQDTGNERSYVQVRSNGWRSDGATAEELV